jgi:dTDP-4-dehydrorhamnose 3,5-epimerase
MVTVKELAIQGVKIISLKRHRDSRGWINESWRDSWSEELGLKDKFVQDMLSWNDMPYTMRGLHGLLAPQYKLVSVVNGSIFDVVVDGREDSPTYKQHISLKITVNRAAMLLVPPGCFHGYLTLEPNTAVAYKVSHYHSAELDRGINWADPALNINWPLNNNVPTISVRDSTHPNL